MAYGFNFVVQACAWMAYGCKYVYKRMTKLTEHKDVLKEPEGVARGGDSK